MDSRNGPDRAPHLDYADLMKASGDLLRMLRKECPLPLPPRYIHPEIPSRAGFMFHQIDNGPGREIFRNLTASKQSAEQRLSAAVTTTVAMVNDITTNDQRHSPWKRPKVGRFTIIDLGANDCRFPLTDSGPHFFCGSPTVDGLAYCPDHARLCFCGPFARG